MLTFLVFFFIAFQCDQVYAMNAAFDATVLLKGNGSIDVDSIKNLSYTHSVYKVKSLFSKELEWNFAVLAKGFSSEKAKDTYVSAIQKLTSVEKTEALDIKPSSVDMVMNVLLGITKAVWTMSGSIPSRPLKPQVPRVLECETVDIKFDEPLFLFVYSHVRDQDALKEYVGSLVTQVLPVLDMEFIYQGIPQSKRWQLFSIQKYDSKKTLCEYLESELAQKYVELYKKAVAGEHTYTAAKI